LSTFDDIKNVEDHLLLSMASCEIAKGLYKGQTLKDLKLAQQDKVCKWFIANCVPEENLCLGLWQLKKVSIFMME
jgi:hypothetical protein